MTVSKLSIALGASLLLHVGVLGTVLWSMRSLPQRASVPNDAVPLVSSLVAVEPPEVAEPTLAADRTPGGAQDGRGVFLTPRQTRPREEVTAERVDGRAAQAGLVPVAMRKAVTPQALAPAPPTLSTAPEVPVQLSSSLPSQDLRRAMLEATERPEAPASVVGFGSMEMLRKERHLEAGLSWVFPKIVAEDKAYWQWPFGALGQVRFDVVLSREGKILETRIVSSPQFSPLAELARRMTRFLAYGTFITGAPLTETGVVVRGFEFSVTHVSRGGNDPGRRGDINEIGFERPEAGRPGHGYVGDIAGQRFDVYLREVPPSDAVLAASPPR